MNAVRADDFHMFLLSHSFAFPLWKHNEQPLNSFTTLSQRVHLRLICPRDRRPDRFGTGCQEEMVECKPAAVVQGYFPGPNIDSVDIRSQLEVDSAERALKGGGNSSACTRDRCAPFLLALDHARLAMRRRRWPSDAEHREKRVPLSSSHPALALGAVLPMA
jgi:hypothetical protein